MKKGSWYRLYPLAVLAVVLLFSSASCSRQPVYPSPAQSGADVVIDISKLPQEVPQFFTYRSGGRNVNFFVLRMNDRTLSFLDACASCYPKKLGYRYENGYVVCRACNMSFSIYKLEKGLGGCFPIRLEGRTDKGNYLIAASTLEKMADKF